MSFDLKLFHDQSYSESGSGDHFLALCMDEDGLFFPW
jgi:hypothetical protein